MLFRSPENTPYRGLSTRAQRERRAYTRREHARGEAQSLCVSREAAVTPECAEGACLSWRLSQKDDREARRLRDGSTGLLRLPEGAGEDAAPGGGEPSGTGACPRQDLLNVESSVLEPTSNPVLSILNDEV